MGRGERGMKRTEREGEAKKAEFFETIRKNDGVVRASFRDLTDRDALVPGYFRPKAVFSDEYLAAIFARRGEDAEWARLAGFRVAERDSKRFAIVSVEYHYSSLRDTVHHVYEIIGAESVRYRGAEIDSNVERKREKKNSDSHQDLEPVSK